MSIASPAEPWATSGRQPAIAIIGAGMSGMDESGPPDLYPRPPQRYPKEMHRPDFSEFRLMDEAG